MRKLFVGGIKEDTEEHFFRDYFKDVGKLTGDTAQSSEATSIQTNTGLTHLKKLFSTENITHLKMSIFVWFANSSNLLNMPTLLK